MSFCTFPQYACPYISTSSTFVCPSHSTSGKRLLCEVVGCTGNVSATPLYYCSASASCKYISPQQSFRCPEHSGSSKAVAVEVGAAVTGTSGFVKESFPFMITDDLQIFRLSTIRSIQLLNEMKITNMGDLSGVQVNVGKEEILKLIRLAITSQTGVLTAVFSKQFSEHLKKRESHKETK
ncbi:hypothetical protein CBR_g31639 [Chara braunii]|uniref:Uncharacterized protein n=1 Tax=Chara braunii TaxID=69332 RepID=A0A388LFK3_CHABU|nr:hypothetical protein CBR_g31639 [Chara braunii]|eukprot:GBG81081.1 hypothetical protein CBR_g31639 [Chara braunii]